MSYPRPLAYRPLAYRPLPYRPGAGLTLTGTAALDTALGVLLGALGVALLWAGLAA